MDAESVAKAPFQAADVRMPVLSVGKLNGDGVHRVILGGAASHVEHRASGRRRPVEQRGNTF